MARYHACTGAFSENDPIRTRYDDAIKTLKEIAKAQSVLVMLQLVSLSQLKPPQIM